MADRFRKPSKRVVRILDPSVGEMGVEVTADGTVVVTAELSFGTMSVGLAPNEARRIGQALVDAADAAEGKGGGDDAL